MKHLPVIILIATIIVTTFAICGYFYQPQVVEIPCIITPEKIQEDAEKGCLDYVVYLNSEAYISVPAIGTACRAIPVRSMRNFGLMAVYRIEKIVFTDYWDQATEFLLYAEANQFLINYLNLDE